MAKKVKIEKVEDLDSLIADVRCTGQDQPRDFGIGIFEAYTVEVNYKGKKIKDDCSGESYGGIVERLRRRMKANLKEVKKELRESLKKGEGIVVDLNYLLRERLRVFRKDERTFYEKKRHKEVMKKFREACEKREDYNKEKTREMVKVMMDCAVEESLYTIPEEVEILGEIYLEWYGDFRKDNVGVGREILEGFYKAGSIWKYDPSPEKTKTFRDFKEGFKKYFPSFSDLEKITICSPREMLEFVKEELGGMYGEGSKEKINYVERIFSLVKEGKHQNLEELREDLEKK